MARHIDAQRWYQNKRSRIDKSVSPRQSNGNGLRADKNGDEKLDISIFCRILVPGCKNACEVSICANDKPTKCYYVWQNILYAPVKDDYNPCKPLYAPRRIIIPSKIKNNAVQLGKDSCVSLYVNRKEISCSCSIDKKFDSGLEIILDETRAALQKAELLQRKISPQNKAKLMKYFSNDFVESIKKEYYFCTIMIKLPESINNNNHNI